MPPVRSLLGHNRVASDLPESQFQDNWVSEHDDEEDWYTNHEFNDSPSYTLTYNSEQEQNSGQDAIYPQAPSNNTTYQPVDSVNASNLNEPFSGSGTTISNDWDPVLGYPDLLLPSTFDELGGEVFEPENRLLFGNHQNSYANQPPHTNTYPQGINFNTHAYGNDMYGPAYAPAAFTLPSSAYQPSLIGTNGVGSRGRQVNHDASKDALLVRLRQEGKSYKEIRDTGCFDGLQESTLRGRYRTLTKNKEQRVRKPTWDQPAVSAPRPIHPQVLTPA